jgi:hypothetical protein
MVQERIAYYIVYLEKLKMRHYNNKLGFKEDGRTHYRSLDEHYKSIQDNRIVWAERNKMLEDMTYAMRTIKGDYNCGLRDDIALKRRGRHCLHDCVYYAQHKQKLGKWNWKQLALEGHRQNS